MLETKGRLASSVSRDGLFFFLVCEAWRSCQGFSSVFVQLVEQQMLILRDLRNFESYRRGEKGSKEGTKEEIGKQEQEGEQMRD